MLVLDRSGTIRHANAAAQDAFGASPPACRCGCASARRWLQDLFQYVLGGTRRDGAVELVEKVAVRARLPRDAGARRRGADELCARLPRPERVAAHRAHARRLHRQCQPRAAHAACSVSGFIETLRGRAGTDAAARERFLQIMQNQTARMARLIDDLLSLSRLEMKPLGLARDSIQLPSLLDEVADSLGHLAAEVGRRIRTGTTRPTCRRCAAAETSLSRCSRTSSRTPAIRSVGRARPAIGAAHDRRGRRERHGFRPRHPREHLPGYDERFYSVMSIRAVPRRGTGLGLSIVKHIVTRHDARLSIASEPEKARVFTVHFALPAD